MNPTAHDRAERAASWIAYHSIHVSDACRNLEFWMPRIADIPEWETMCEAELNAAEARLIAALDDVRKARAVFAAGRTQTLIAAE